MFAFTAIDFETTGSVPGHPNEPWQVGLVAFSNSQQSLDEATSLESLLRISPDRPFNKWAPGRHAQLRQELSLAPTPAQFWPEMSALLSGVPAVAHNTGTERTLLRKIAPLHEQCLWIDTLALARKVWPSAKSHALEDLIPALGLSEKLAMRFPGRMPHDALYDAAACAILLMHIHSLPGWNALSPEELASMH